MSLPADRALAPPQGGTPPADAVVVDGETVFLAPLAREIARRHWDEFPDERGRYGDAGFEWCVHDTQYILWWATLDGEDDAVLERQLAWLARLLSARGYPLERLRRAVEIAAEVTAERHESLSAALRAGAATLPV